MADETQAPLQVPIATHNFEDQVVIRVTPGQPPQFHMNVMRVYAPDASGQSQFAPLNTDQGILILTGFIQSMMLNQIHSQGSVLAAARG